jgi:hypothetical protein
MLGGHSGLKPPDAIHIATALITPRLEEMQTFDAALIDLDGVFDNDAGGRLKVCKPQTGAPSLPLLQRMQGNKPDEAIGG